MTGVRMRKPPGKRPPMMTPGEVAARLGVDEQTLKVWRMGGKGPPYARPGGRYVRYDPELLEIWISSMTRAGKHIAPSGDA